MALSRDVRGSVRIPRLYVDYIQYAKAIGYVDSMGLTNLDGLNGSNANSIWNLNPVNMNSYRVNVANDQDCGFDITFKNSSSLNKQFGYFLGSLNYFGILNHRLGIELTNCNTARIIGRDLEFNSNYSHPSQKEIVGDPNSINHIGYSLYETDIFAGSKLNKLRLNLWSGDNQTNLIENEIINVGSVSIGRYYEFPHSTNLSMNIKYDADGISNKRTISGSDLTNINYTKPSWGDLSAWSHIDLEDYENPEEAYTNENYSEVSYQGRRSWDLTFSSLSKDDTFTKNMEQNMSGQYSKGGYFDLPIMSSSNKDTMIGNFLTFTLNGQIPFLFQPDSTKQDIVMAKLKSNSLSINQSAPNLYTAKMNFVEVW